MKQAWHVDFLHPLYEIAQGTAFDALLFHSDWRWLMAVIDRIGQIDDSPHSLKPGQWVLIRIELKLCGMFLIMHQIELDGSSRKRYSYDVQIGDPGISDRQMAWWNVCSEFCQDWVDAPRPAQTDEGI